MRTDHDHVDALVTSIADYLVGSSSCEKGGLEDEASAEPPCHIRESDGGFCRISALRHNMNHVQPRRHFQGYLAGHLSCSLRGVGEICREQEIADPHVRAEEQWACHVRAGSRRYSTRQPGDTFARGAAERVVSC